MIRLFGRSVYFAGAVGSGKVLRAAVLLGGGLKELG